MGEWKSLKTDSGTGWKEIYREAGTGWKALEWEGVAIDVGGACIDRGSFSTGSITRILKDNPANATGTLTSICIFVYYESSDDVYIGTFHFNSLNNLTCKSVVNVGALSLGENNKNVSLAITEGDYIGIYGGDTNWENDFSGGLGIWYNYGNMCILDEQNWFMPLNDNILSVYGTG